MIVRRVLLAACLWLLLVAPASARCPCDCNGDGSVALNEIIAAINVAFGAVLPSACPYAPSCPFEPCLIIHSLVGCIDAALDGCP